MSHSPIITEIVKYYLNIPLKRGHFFIAEFVTL